MYSTLFHLYFMPYIELYMYLNVYSYFNINHSVKNEHVNSLAMVSFLFSHSKQVYQTKMEICMILSLKILSIYFQ